MQIPYRKTISHYSFHPGLPVYAASFFSFFFKRFRCFWGVRMTTFTTMQTSGCSSAVWFPRLIEALQPRSQHVLWQRCSHCHSGMTEVCICAMSVWSLVIYELRMVFNNTLCCCSLHVSAQNPKTMIAQAHFPLSVISFFYCVCVCVCVWCVCPHALAALLCNGRRYQLRIRPHLSWEIQR